jgi:hypothetical protein
MPASASCLSLPSAPPKEVTMENFDAKHLAIVLEKQGQLLERIAKAAERSNEIL